VTFRVVALRDQCRAQVERLIRTIYWERFTAQPGLLPQTLVADVCGAGTVECAAGIRYSNHGFFSEWYLNQPVEVALRFRTGRIADRTRVIEVCNLVARRPGSSLPFVRSNIEFAEAADVDWAIFTATNPLRALLARSGLKMVELVRASRGRVPNPEDWGSYYEHDPRVMAVHHDAAFISRRRIAGEPARAAFLNA
jgi:Thermostable hemolysin